MQSDNKSYDQMLQELLEVPVNEDTVVIQRLIRYEIEGIDVVALAREGEKS